MSNKQPRILLLDIETFPNEGYTWGKWQQDVIDFTNHWYILCFGYCWHGEPGGVKVVSLPDFKGYKAKTTDDKSLLAALHDLLDEADYVVAHNAKAFDLRKIFTRMIQHGMKPPSTFKVIDTLTEARKFSFNSSKLDDVGRDTKLGRKMPHTGFPLWLACHNGDRKGWDIMERYNKRDVVLLDKLFKRLKPWIGYLSGRGTPYVKRKDILGLRSA